MEGFPNHRASSAILFKSTIAFVVVMSLSCGPQFSEDSSTSSIETRPGKVGIPKLTLFAMKDQNPFVVTSLSAEIGTLRALEPSSQEEYLLRRGLAIVIDGALKRHEYEGKDHFWIKMVLVSGKDEYDRARWGNALVLALLEIDREAIVALKAFDVDTLPLAQVQQLVKKHQLTLDSISKLSK
jgi:hypothetical protein